MITKLAGISMGRRYSTLSIRQELTSGSVKSVTVLFRSFQTLKDIRTKIMPINLHNIEGKNHFKWRQAP